MYKANLFGIHYFIAFLFGLNTNADRPPAQLCDVAFIFCLFLVPNEVKAVQNIKGASLLNESVFMNKLVERMI